MSNFFTYQQIDSLHQEGVDSIAVPSREEVLSVGSLSGTPVREAKKKRFEEVEKIDSVFYGVENTENIPIRYIEKVVLEEVSLKKSFDPDIKFQQISAWQSIVLLTAFLLLALAKAFSDNRFRQTYRSLFNYRVAQEVCTEERVFFHRVNVLLMAVYFLMGALLVYHLRDFFSYGDESAISWLFFPVIVGFLVVINLGKFLFAKVLSFIFDIPQLVSGFLFNITLYNNLLGVLLLPVVSLLYFTSLDISFILFWLALPLLSVIFLLRIIRLVVLGGLYGVSYLYIIVYICTLEILPLVVMIKFFIFS